MRPLYEYHLGRYRNLLEYANGPDELFLGLAFTDE